MKAIQMIENAKNEGSNPIQEKALGMGLIQHVVCGKGHLEAGTRIHEPTSLRHCKGEACNAHRAAKQGVSK